MRKIIAALYLTLDGVMENPAWTGPYFNDELSQLQHELLFASDALLLGRVTYQGFAAAWPGLTDEEGFAERMNSLPKYIASQSLKQAAWNATLLGENVVEEITQLRQQPGRPLLVYGSGQLVHTLMQHDLIDEYCLMVHPVVLGSGQQLFQPGSMAKLKLLTATTTRTGVAVLTYAPARG